MRAAQGGIPRSSRKRQHPVGSVPCQLSGQVGRSTTQSRRKGQHWGSSRAATNNMHDIQKEYKNMTETQSVTYNCDVFTLYWSMEAHVIHAVLMSQVKHDG